MGYMSPALDDIQKAFVHHCTVAPSGLFLDIGCGFGVATLPVIEKGCQIIACDLESKHLDVLKNSVPLEKISLLTLMTGHFPDTVTFPENQFDGINLSMVLHFYRPDEIEKVFREIFFSLKPGGRLFLTTSSPYQRVLLPFVPIYESQRGVEEWPGYIADIAQYVPHRAPLLPKENIVFCIHELRRLALKHKFHVVYTTFFSREGIPEDLCLDGREYSGIICEKPLERPSAFRETNKAIIPTNAAKMR
jgi:SAM-dependent methyltransferase